MTSLIKPAAAGDASPNVVELSVVIPAWKEASNLAKLLPELHRVLTGLHCPYEIIVVDNHSVDGTEKVCAAADAVLIQQVERGYGGALWAGFERATGEYILTMDADLSHTPDFVPRMWNRRADAELIVASRYVEGGTTDMPGYRHILSIILNVVYTRLLALPVKDISSGFRLYHAAAVRDLDLQSTDFDALEEILIECYARGYRIIEVPFRYVPRDEGKSKVQLFRFGLAYLKTLLRMWRLRNSIHSADYDARAFDSPIPLQRYWQRERYRIVTSLVDKNRSCLDIGCGSSRILRDLGRRSVGLDVQRAKLCYARCYGRPLVNASLLALPFPDESFEQVVCSQVIEHLPQSVDPFPELNRVLKRGGRLILGTPDYGRRVWRFLEALYRRVAPGGYADEHITHYTLPELTSILGRLGFETQSVHYVGGAELIMAACKPETAQPAQNRN